MQLVAYGAQDVYLTGNPQITFFKVAYRRYTNFSMQCIEVTANGNPDFGKKFSITIPRNGDLIMELYLRVRLAAVKDNEYLGKFAWTKRLGHAIIRDVQLNIGGSQIDKHYGTWMDIWYELTHTDSLEWGYRKMIGDVPELTELSEKNENGLIKPEYTMFIPLQFWFCRNPGLSLPLIALQYHEVRLDIEFQRKEQLIVHSPDFTNYEAYRNLAIADMRMLANYVYLDSEERRKFAQVGHEYLIEQLQHTGSQNVPPSSSNIGYGGEIKHSVQLNFNHPSKELVWVLKNGNFQGQKFLAYTSNKDWTSALDDAAANIANGMFYIGIPDTGKKTVNITSMDGLVDVSNEAISHELNYTIEIISDISDQSTITPDIAQANLQMVQDVFVSGRYNLATKLDNIAITLTATLDTDGVTVLYEITKIVVLTHRFTIRDVSIPVGHWNDKRVYSDGITVSPDDIIVWDHSNYGCLIDGTENPVDKGIIKLNGQDRFDIREGSYFNYVQPNEHHTHTPADGINVYSFAINPETHQPSGTANLSRIDTTYLDLTYKDPTHERYGNTHPSLGMFNSNTQLYVYCFNYNVLRIMSGMGGLAYSN